MARNDELSDISVKNNEVLAIEDVRVVLDRIMEKRVDPLTGPTALSELDLSDKMIDIQCAKYSELCRLCFLYVS
jgi:hypothetical protein